MKSTILTAFFCAIVAIPAQAQNPQAFEATFMYYYFDYSENLQAPLRSDETAWLPGYRLAYSYVGSDVSLYGSALFEFTEGNTDYNGTTQQGEPIKLTSKHKLLRGEADLGYSFRWIGGVRIHLTPYSGLAYRLWERRIGDADPRGYREVYSW